LLPADPPGLSTDPYFDLAACDTQVIPTNGIGQDPQGSRHTAGSLSARRFRRRTGETQ